MPYPAHKPTAESRERVAVLAGGGMSHASIAMVLGIARETLEKHYESELSVGAENSRAEVLEAMRTAAMKGNVSAAKFYLAHEPGLAAPPLPEELGASGDAAPVAEGKKAQAAAAAKTAAAGTEWDELLGAANVVAIRR